MSTPVAYVTTSEAYLLGVDTDLPLLRDSLEDASKAPSKARAE